MMREPGMMGGHGGGPGPHGGPGWEGHGSMMDALDLTAEQHDKIRALHEDAREKSWDTMGKLRTETYKLRNLYRGDQLDAKAIDEQQKKVDDLRRQLLQARIGVHNQIVGILTPEQRAKLHNFAPWRMHGDMD